MRFPSSFALLLSSFALLLASLSQTQAQYLINELSFGHGHRYVESGIWLHPGRVRLRTC